MVIVTKENFKQEVSESQKPVLIDFWASWCGPCQMLMPVMEQIEKEEHRVKFCKINVDEQTSLAEKYQIMTIPTLVMVKSGEVVEESIGMKSQSEIMEMIDRAVR
ncbi:MAG: thioredoxin [Lachnospiraceae bacterium]|nr:thioredoxin [Lachnospiraceae bacterium]